MVEQFLQRLLVGEGIRTLYLADCGARPVVGCQFQERPRISICLSGRHATQLSHNGRTAAVWMEPGEAVFIPTGAWNKLIPDSDKRFMVVAFDREGTTVSLHEARCGERSIAAELRQVHRPLEEAGRHLIEVLCSAGMENSPCRHLSLVANALLVYVQRLLKNEGNQPPGRSEQLWLRLYHFVQENSHGPVNLEMISEEFRIHPVHVSRLFRRYGQAGFAATLAGLRMKNAENLLLNTHLSIEEIAFACGYTSSSYFCQTFRKKHDMTPSEYRQCNT